VLVELAELLDRAPLRKRAAAALAHYARRIATQPMAMPEMLVAMQRSLAGSRHVVIASPGSGGDGTDATGAAMARAFHEGFRPNDSLVRVDERPSRARLAALVPWLGPLSARGGQATAYVCVERACKAPAQTVEEFVAALEG
jgi:uncharacterized protein YyaL (SSP411 family)